MCLAYVNYIFCIACLKVTGLTPDHFWSISCIGAVTSSTNRIVIEGLITPIARLVGVEPNPNDRVAVRRGQTLLLLNKWNSIWSIVGASVGFILGTGLCLSQILIAPPSWTGLISTFDSVPKSWHDLPYLFHQLTLRLLVHPNHPSFMTILTCILPLGPFKRSKLLYELIQKLSVSHFGALFRSGMMTSVRWLPPRTNISKTLGPT